MSFRRSRPSATKASARFDLLSRVILAAFTAGTLILDLGLDPLFLGDPAILALPEETNPGREQPTGNEPARQNVNDFPHDHAHGPITNCRSNHRVRSNEEKIMDCRDQQKPADAEKVGADEFLVSGESGLQGLV